MRWCVCDACLRLRSERDGWHYALTLLAIASATALVSVVLGLL